MINKVIQQPEYYSIFFEAIIYKEIELIAKYFEGKYNEIRSCNPYELYKDGLNKAYEYYKYKVKTFYYEGLTKQNKPKSIDSIFLPCIYENSQISGHYSLSDIERINKGLIMFNETYKKTTENNTGTKAKSKGFASTLTTLQIDCLFKLLKGNYIDINTNPEHFNAIFKNELLPNDFEPVKWIDKGKTRHENNIQTLYELLYLLKESKYLDKTDFDTTATNENNLYRKIGNCFAGFKNISVKNPNETMQDTARKKELKNTVISL